MQMKNQNLNNTNQTLTKKSLNKIQKIENLFKKNKRENYSIKIMEMANIQIEFRC